MRKCLFFIVCALCFCACKPTPEQLVKRFILDKAIDPSSVRVLYHSEVLRPERTKQDTLYHLISIDSICACSDSIRIETRHFPEHYYCYWTIEGNDSSAQPFRCNIELAVMPDGDVMSMINTASCITVPHPPRPAHYLIRSPISTGRTYIRHRAYGQSGRHY